MGNEWAYKNSVPVHYRVFLYIRSLLFCYTGIIAVQRQRFNALEKFITLFVRRFNHTILGNETGRIQRNSLYKQIDVVQLHRKNREKVFAVVVFSPYISPASSIHTLIPTYLKYKRATYKHHDSVTIFVISTSRGKHYITYVPIAGLFCRCL